MNKIEYEELIAFHPGYYVKEMIEERGISQEELAKCLCKSTKDVDGLLSGEIEINEELAHKLALLFGTSSSLWLALNTSFINKKVEIEKQMIARA